MTVAEVEQQLIKIAREAPSDQESATSMERRLHRDVLMAVAGGAKEAAALCRAAARSFELQFQRIS